MQQGIFLCSDHIKLDLKSNLMEAPHCLTVYVGVFILYRLKVVIYIELVELSLNCTPCQGHFELV